MTTKKFPNSKFPNIEYECYEIQKVLLLVETNRKKLYMPFKNINKHSINRGKIEEVVKNIRDHSCLTGRELENCILFFRRIMQIMRYVNFYEFLKVIQVITSEITSFLIDYHKNYDVIFFGGLDLNVNKSYTWILFLFLNQMHVFKFFDNYPDIANKIFVGNHELEIREPYTPRVLYLFFDDMSYSGTQIAHEINHRYTRSSFLRQIPIPNFEVYITAPFISTTAKARIIDLPFVKYWSSTKIIPTLKEQFLAGLAETDIQRYTEIYNLICDIELEGNKKYGFQCRSSIIPIYFDHKIADSISTFNKLLYFGTYPIDRSNPSCQPRCIITPLINNCSENVNIVIKYFEDKNYCSRELMDIPPEKTCPPTFYKSIEYSLPSPPNPSYEEIKKHIESTQPEITLMSILKFYDTRTTVFNSGITTSSSAAASALNKYLLEYENLDYKRKYNKYKEKYLELKKNKNI